MIKLEILLFFEFKILFELKLLKSLLKVNLYNKFSLAINKNKLLE
jgi:hypothetical protein